VRGSMDGKTPIQKILVIKLRHIGDVLLSSALFHNLKEAFPRAQVSALVNSGTEEMLTGNPFVDRVFVYDRGIKQEPLVRRLSGEFSFYRMLRRERFDAVLNLTEGDRGALVALLSGAQVRAGLDPQQGGMLGKRWFYTHILPRNPEGNLHALEKNLLFLEPLGAATTSKRARFPFAPEDRDHVTELLAAEPGGYFHAHVTSRWIFKALPHRKAAFLIDQLAERSGLLPVLTCAAEQRELDYLAALLPLLRTRYRDLSGVLTLKQVGALSAGARFFVGVDSAPMHMAAALDIPVLGLFGPSTAQEWGPWDNALEANGYLSQNGLQHSGRHTVLQAGGKCVPCCRDGCNGSKVSDCLDFPEEKLCLVSADFLQRLDAGTLKSGSRSVCQGGQVG
jgi:heptosyltransferase III